MKYKAIIMDIDGTAVLNVPDAIPSMRVLRAIKRAQEKIYVCACTSRPIFTAKNIIRVLGIQDPCGINDATQIYSPRKETIISSFLLSHKAAALVSAYLIEKKISFMVNIGESEEIYKGGQLPNTVCSLCIPEVPLRKSKELVKDLSQFHDISIQTPPSYTKGNVWVNITSSTATKLHSVMEITKFIGVKPDDVIGIGDGYNDFPLLSACGLKIAMGNAVSELKAIADFVAPPVEEDGVAVVIEKFVLS